MLSIDAPLINSSSMRELTDIEKKRNRIAWSAAESNITKADADVLVIFDCCQVSSNSYD